jgi:hypothetical protein
MRSDLAFGKLKFFKVSTNFILSQNWKKMFTFLFFMYPLNLGILNLTILTVQEPAVSRILEF